MIRGHFNDGCPHFVGHVFLPGVGLGGMVDFVVDTGATDTVLAPAQLTLLKAKYDQLIGEEKNDTYVGFGGEMEGKIVDAVVALRDLKYEYEYRVALMVLKPDFRQDWLLGLPSVIGRDIIKRLRLVCDFPRGIMAASPANWDRKTRRSIHA